MRAGTGLGPQKRHTSCSIAHRVTEANVKSPAVRTRCGVLLTGLALFGTSGSAVACEPIVPFVKTVVGPSVLTIALVVLGVVVLLKSAVFARFQNKLSFSKALLWMLGANVLTSIVGLTAPAMVGSGLALFIGLPIIWALCLLPAQRFLTAASLTPLGRCAPLARCTPRALALGITVALVFSYLLMSISRMVHDSDSFALWMTKMLTIYVALAFGIALTAFWEEWVVWWLSRSDEHDLSFVRPVIRANLIVLVAVMVISTGFMIPMRIKGSTAKQSKVAVEAKTSPSNP
jgi:hypothetical protein